MPKWSENIDHLAYAYDTIIFTSTDKFSLQMIMGVLKDYESQSGQLINKEKSFFFVYHKIAYSDLIRVSSLFIIKLLTQISG